MNHSIKNQQDILDKLQIKALNPMQEEAVQVIPHTANTILLSPTGTGKTLAFLLPLLKTLRPDIKEIQALIVVPSRELAIQIEQVLRTMGTGYKVNAVYGGRAVAKDKVELQHTPAILVGTPGRILDHFYSDRFGKASIKTLVLDEFDKSLAAGFEEEMSGIIEELPHLEKRILTSATQGVAIPSFVHLTDPKIIDYLLEQKESQLSLQTVTSPTGDKLPTLLALLKHIGNEPGIIFCNLKDSIAQVSAFLNEHGIAHECFYGGLEQKDRERSLIKFRNGTCRLLIATDLAARGIDIPELHYIIHLELPIHEEEFIHRNGRTARVQAKGTAYVLKAKNEHVPSFIKESTPIVLTAAHTLTAPYWETLFISGGRKDKISKGDIAGLFFKQGGLQKEELGVIELKTDCAFVAVPLKLAHGLVKRLNNSRLKHKKIRITVL
ncbi:DEAD/DEAH box helicase [Zhouia sp. PK063]|uniref:DEAD/DEAH box helicase n=1 Tax=Zhouia sp. PK063 TaxID=3373602 RepID=UPI0037B784BA